MKLLQSILIAALLLEAVTMPVKQEMTLQIFKPTDSGSYKLNGDALEAIFNNEKVADKPVAIYSLAGALRTGKSFMLNLFIRYLSKEGTSWLANETTTLETGFKWRGGKDACTGGIWIWKEPFFVKNHQEKEMAVFLMDTEGSFDSTSDNTKNGVVFSLSTLISSCQIFNVMRQLQQDNLQFFQVFTKYAKLAVSEANNRNSTEKPFQALIFLIRDFHDPAYKGFKGGKEVLDELLDNEPNKKEPNSIGNNIKNCFDSVSCFLMESPGPKIRSRSKDQPAPTISDLGEDFRASVDEFVSHIFNPSNIIVKRLNKKQLTGKDMVTLIKAYSKIFTDGRMPKIKSILEANQEAEIRIIVESCISLYREEMLKKTQSGYVPEIHLNELHKNTLLMALKKFNDTSKLGDEEFLKSHRRFVADNSLQIYKSIEMNNTLQKMKAEKDADEHIQILIKQYDHAMKKKFCSNGYVKEDILREFHVRFTEYQKEKFEKRHHNLPKKIEKFENTHSEIFEKYRNANEERKPGFFTKAATASAVAGGALALFGAGPLALAISGAAIVATKLGLLEELHTISCEKY